MRPLREASGAKLTVNSILITGSSGFLGRHLLSALDPRRFQRIYCLSRRDRSRLSGISNNLVVEWLHGSLFDLGRYERELATTDTVIHLAAATGKAPRREYFTVNVDGTRVLIEHCHRLGVKRFLYVSSIAVRFPDKRRYYYAQSKEQGEQLVRSGGLRYTILRPTIILGQGSPVWTGLCKLANLPVIPVFGDGKTLIQPIHVEDLVSLILTILDREVFGGETLELGGPGVISIEEFLKKVHQQLFQSRPRTMHISLAVLLPVLALLEPVLFPLLPITVGQLASFRYNGTAEPNWLSAERVSTLKSIDEMLISLSAQ